MRAIAGRAGVSVGNSYHYFPSKEHLVLELYRHLHDVHRAASGGVLERERALTPRLRGVLRAIVLTWEPLHDVAGSIFSTVADPRSPLNPFSPDSAPLREESIGLFRRVVEGSDARLPADLAAELPQLLWLYQMSILYFWIMDSSPGRLRTLEVIDETSELIGHLVQLANLPVLRKSRQRALALVHSMAAAPHPDLSGARLPT